MMSTGSVENLDNENGQRIDQQQHEQSTEERERRKEDRKNNKRKLDISLCELIGCVIVYVLFVDHIFRSKCGCTLYFIPPDFSSSFVVVDVSEFCCRLCSMKSE